MGRKKERKGEKRKVICESFQKKLVGEIEVTLPIIQYPAGHGTPLSGAVNVATMLTKENSVEGNPFPGKFVLAVLSADAKVKASRAVTEATVR